MKHNMQLIKQRAKLEVVIADDEDKRIAFTESLLKCYNQMKRNDKIVVKAYTLDDKYKWFSLSSNHNIMTTLNHIAGTIDLTEDASDVNPCAGDVFNPVRYELIFINQDEKNRFTTNVLNEKTNKIEQEELELDDEYRAKPDGEFFPYINLTNIDLSCLQIFNNVNPKNYKDSCFIYACIQSGVFTKKEIEQMRYYVQTRKLSNDKIITIAEKFKCNFVIRRIDENQDIKHQQQIKINTTKQFKFDRCVELLLFKEHYMIYKRLPLTTFYITNQKMLDEQFKHIPLKQRQLIRKLK